VDKAVSYIKNRLDLTTQDATEMFEYLKSHWSSAKVSLVPYPCEDLISARRVHPNRKYPSQSLPN
jgi:hypothetical protein